MRNNIVYTMPQVQVTGQRRGVQAGTWNAQAHRHLFLDKLMPYERCLYVFFFQSKARDEGGIISASELFLLHSSSITKWMVNKAHQ